MTWPRISRPFQLHDTPDNMEESDEEGEVLALQDLQFDANQHQQGHAIIGDNQDDDQVRSGPELPVDGVLN